MGDPMNGDVYEGQLRPGDIGLTKEEADYFKEISMQDRMAEFQKRFMERPAQAAGEGGVSREMPRYKCHKEVWALKIAEINPIYSQKPTIAELEALIESRIEIPMEASGNLIGGYIITPADEGFAPFEISMEYMGRHKPGVGGYFVVYQDGYKSYSPAKAFEEGYMRL